MAAAKKSARKSSVPSAARAAATESPRKVSPTLAGLGADQEIDPGALLFDPANYRLTEHVGSAFDGTTSKQLGEPAIQEALLKALENSRFDVRALVQSISYNGFLKHERLIVVPFDGSRYLVLEGNRRLAAVRLLLADPNELSPRARESLATLPCFVLQGPPVKGNDEALQTYRQEASIYVGLRHLMGPKEWQPTGRYAFLAHLVLDDGRSIAEVEDRFARSRHRILNDIRGHLLYRRFQTFLAAKHPGEEESPVTYNAFAEIGKAPDIYNWLGWNGESREFERSSRVSVLFEHLYEQLSEDDSAVDDADNEDARHHVIAERLVRSLRDLLKLKDDDINALLEDGDFDRAQSLYELRKQGSLLKRLREIDSMLRGVNTLDLKSEANSANGTGLIRLLATIVAGARTLHDAAAGYASST
jgi:hypothetical protein